MLKRRFLGSLIAVLLVVGLTVGAAGATTSKTVLFERIQTVFNVVEAWHKDGADLEKFVQGAIKGGLEALGDRHTNYFSPTEYGAFMESLNGSFSGIGAYLEQDGNYVVITSPIKGSPAHKAGLMPGDRILEANGAPLVGATTDKAVSLIRGPAGTEVTLKIERPSESRTFTVTITRAQISIPEVEYEMLPGQIGYIQVASFGDDVVSDFHRAYEALKAQGAKGLVLDLRGNGGGYLQAAVELSSWFVPRGETVLWEVGRDSKTPVTSIGRGPVNVPVAVLVDKGTASASEILAGALQDHGKATVVGVQTFGKGTVQQILSLTDGSGMKVTIAEYLTPKERKVDGVGLTPDHVVELPKLNEERTRPMEFTRRIGSGMVGLDVLYLQYRLQDLGHDVEQDGFFGLKTRNAVRAFNSSIGQGAVDSVGPEFLEALNAQVTAKAKATKQKDTQLDKALEVIKGQMK